MTYGWATGRFELFTTSSPTQQFVRSYRVDALVLNAEASLSFVVTNNSSFKSFGPRRQHAANLYVDGATQVMSRLLLLLLLGMVSSCSREVGKAELPDVYRFISGNLKQEVTIGQDGKYLNAFYREGTLVWSDQENWTYEGQKGQAGVTLSKFRFGIAGHSDVPGYWFVVPERTLAGVKKLCFDPDLNQCFSTR